MPDIVEQVDRARDVEGDGPTTDRRIAGLAAQQHGVVARRQMLAIGIGREAVQHRLETGRLHAVVRGVYAVGHAGLSREGRWMAAVLAAGPGAVLSHRSAAVLRRMLDRPGAVIHVTAPRRRRAGRHVRVHVSILPVDEMTTWRGIPVTTAARTLFDLAQTERPTTTKTAYDEAQYRRLTSPAGLPTLLERHPRRPGAAVLRDLLGRAGRLRTETEMEAEFLAFCAARGLCEPDHTNVERDLHGRTIRADAVYQAARIIVELDGGSHRTAKRLDDDRARDRANLAEGNWRTVRITSRHLDHEADELAADLLVLVGPRS